MLEEMHITYGEFSTLNSTASLQQTIFDRYVRTSETTLGSIFTVCIAQSATVFHLCVDSECIQMLLW